MPARAAVTPAGALTALALAAPLAGATVLAFRSGGYFVSDWGVAAALLLVLLGGLALVPGATAGGRLGLAALGGLVALAAWQGLSSAWAAEPAAAIDAMGQTLLYAAAAGLVLVGVRRAGDLRLLIAGALAATAAVAAAALAVRLLPSLVSGDVQARLSYPISYWNGLGAIVALGALLAVAEAGHGGRPLPWRAAAGVLVPPLLLVLLLTYSRGAVLALAVALVLLVALVPGRLETVVAVAAAGLVSAPLLVHVNGLDELAALGGELPPHADAGRRVLLLLLLTMAGAAAAVVLTALPPRRLGEGGRRRAAMATAAACIVLAAAGAAAAWPAQGPVGWAGDQFDSFRSFDPGARAEAGSLSGRLAVAAGSGRWQNWSVAGDQFRDSPLAGTGAGDYRMVWDRERPIELDVQNAHSLYLEVLGESGVVGLLLLLVPAACLAAAAAPVLRRGGTGHVPRDVGVASAGAFLIALHAAGDWDWQLPAVMLPGVALGAGALAAARLGHGRPVGGPARAALAVVCLAGALVVAAGAGAQRMVDGARDAAVRGDLTGALATAEDAAGLRPNDPEPRLLAANLLTDLGRHAEADRAFAAAAARSPEWIVWADWAAALLRRGDRPAAVAATRRAAAANPLEDRVAYLRAALRP